MLYAIIVNKQKHSCKFILTVIWRNCCEQESFGKGTMLAVLGKKIGHTFLILIHANDYTLTYITIYSFQDLLVGNLSTNTYRPPYTIIPINCHPHTHP